VARPGAGGLSVRVRTSVGAVLAVIAATSVFAVLVLAVLHDHLTEEVADVARSRAAEVAMLLGDGPAGSPLAVVDPEHDAVQVVRDDGTVAAASPNLAGRPAMVWPVPPEPVQVVGPQDAEALLVVAQPAGPDRTVLVARTVQARDDSVLFVATLLAVGLPVLVLVVGLLCWTVVGRALRPVEAIRREVDAISSSALHRRVSEPPGADEISRLATTMNRMLDRLDRAQQQQRRFVSDASHELRSPIAAIRQHAEVATMHPARTSVPELARAVLNEDLRVQNLVEDLLLLARTDEHGRPHAAAVDLDDLVFDEARHLRRTTAVRVDVSAVSGGRTYGDAEALRRVLRNLGENGARHASSTIAFALHEQADGVELVVDDDGPGIPPQERERVLQRFVRLDEARNRDDGGAGLGLAIVAEVVAAHGGRVSVEDSPHGGARFRLSFPGVPAPHPAEPASRPAPGSRAHGPH
jgi:signal transduction histidine kinase